MPTVLVIGDVMTDIIVRPEGPVAVAADMRAAIRMLPGGAGANQACWLAFYAASLGCAGRVGDAAPARQNAVLRGDAVDARLSADAALPPRTLVTGLAPDGDRSFRTDRAANLRLRRPDLPDSLL